MQEIASSNRFEEKRRFQERYKLLSNRQELIKIGEDIGKLISSGKMDEAQAILKGLYPPDIADLMIFVDNAKAKTIFNSLDLDEQAEVLDEVDGETKARLLHGAPSEQVAKILSILHSDEDADILGVLEPRQREPVLALMDPDKAGRIRQLLAYPKETAGGIMSTGYIAVPLESTLGEALQIFKDHPGAEPLYDIYVVDNQGGLAGVLDLRRLISGSPEDKVQDHIQPAFITVPPLMDQEQVARIFARYDLLALPVVDLAPDGKLFGVITPDDMIDVIQQENTEDFMRMTGSDAEEMEKRSPARLALLRLPWIMATMFIELMAGFVIHFFDATLARVLLLASFMPIISAISGNTGLQSATIIVRGLSTGKILITEWKRAVLRQLTMTLILGGVTGLTIGIIGALWYGKAMFGVVVGVGMFTAVNIAGVVGTVVPLTSKRLGFDPAITSGPFETAFQDVVGISIFLSLATLLIHYLM